MTTSPSTANDAAVIALLHRIAAAVERTAEASEEGARSMRRIEASMAKRRAVLSDTDREALERLLPAIEDSRGWCTWSTAELAKVAEVDEELGSALGGLSPRELGRLLTRAIDADLPGWKLRRCNRARSGWEWRIERCDEND